MLLVCSKLAIVKSPFYAVKVSWVTKWCRTFLPRFTTYSQLTRGKYMGTAPCGFVCPHPHLLASFTWFCIPGSRPLNFSVGSKDVHQFCLRGESLGTRLYSSYRSTSKGACVEVISPDVKGLTFAEVKAIDLEQNAFAHTNSATHTPNWKHTKAHSLSLLHKQVEIQD